MVTRMLLPLPWLSELALALEPEPVCALAGAANISAKAGTITTPQKCRADGKRLHISSSFKDCLAIQEFMWNQVFRRLDRGSIEQPSVHAPVPEFLNFPRCIGE